MYKDTIIRFLFSFNNCMIFGIINRISFFFNKQDANNEQIISRIRAFFKQNFANMMETAALPFVQHPL
ncbi:MAG: hypothetical protein LBL06_03845 [Treponema sp.]|jgi:hypothetical protein|nr:hypothetical protein [Treponema sp.]